MLPEPAVNMYIPPDTSTRSLGTMPAAGAKLLLNFMADCGKEKSHLNFDSPSLRAQEPEPTISPLRDSLHQLSQPPAAPRSPCGQAASLLLHVGAPPPALRML